MAFFPSYYFRSFKTLIQNSGKTILTYWQDSSLHLKVFTNTSLTWTGTVNMQIFNLDGTVCSLYYFFINYHCYMMVIFTFTVVIISINVIIIIITIINLIVFNLTVLVCWRGILVIWLDTKQFPVYMYFQDQLQQFCNICWIFRLS